MKRLVSLMSNSPIILAVDTKEISVANSLIESTKEYIGVYKLGLEFFLANGRSGVQEIQTRHPGTRIFLDLKLHDIPNTVAKAATSLESLGIEFLTVHASGGSAMIEGAAKALPKTKIVAVTVLTSLDSAELAKLGLGTNVEKIVVNWAQSAIQSGAKAIVASPLEVSALRNALPSDIELITPGIRFESGKDDQARTMSPAEAIAAGADYLVVGRPISGAPNPGRAAQEIFKSVTK